MIRFALILAATIFAANLLANSIDITPTTGAALDRDAVVAAHIAE